MSLALISASVLIYQQWIKRTQLQRLENQARQQYILQEINLISTTDLANNHKIHSFFSDLLRNYAGKFSESKSLDISPLPLKFEGLYNSSNLNNGYETMGKCWKEPKTAKISFNRLYLLNKFGHDKYFTSNPQYGDYTYLDISFNKMINTCSHELAHYIQLVKHGKSSCESDLILKNGKYDEELAKEHKEFTQEIYQLVKNSPKYSEWEKKWKEIN